MLRRIGERVSHNDIRGAHLGDVCNMESHGATVTASINTLVQSGRSRASASKRIRVGPTRMGLAMFQHRKVDDYEKRAFADSDISLFAEDPPFFGFVAFDEDPTRDAAFITCAVGGRVNVLNTSIWPIRAFDRVCVLVQKRGTGQEWIDTYFNRDLEQIAQCALVCSKEYYENYQTYFEASYTMYEIGYALTNETYKGSAQMSHLFSVQMNEFKHAL